MATDEETLSVRVIREAFTYDDLLLVPQRSSVIPSQAETKTRFSRNVSLNIPLASAAMDTVTEARLAIALARQGGIGIIHRNLTVQDHAAQVVQVKRSTNGIIIDPISLTRGATVREAKEIMAARSVSGLPILDDEKVVGILTRRDLRLHDDLDARVDSVMTRKLVTASPGTTLDQARSILHEHKVEKLLLVDSEGTLAGLITMKDIDHLVQFPHASRDQRGRLRVGAAIGVREFDRAKALIEAGCDVLVVDTAHGHSEQVLETVRELKRQFETDIVAGNVATSKAATDLIEAGVDAVKVGIGPGSICTTRVVAGVGVPQLTAIMDTAEVAAAQDCPIIADGGIRHSGDIVKALAAGAESVMIGALLAGLDEAPGELVLYRGRSYKAVRGMGSLGAMQDGGKARYGQADVQETAKLVPEGVEGLVPAKGALAGYAYQLVGGVRSGMGYCGAKTLKELRHNAEFIRISSASLRENHPHDIRITKESPNYLAEE